MSQPFLFSLFVFATLILSAYLIRSSLAARQRTQQYDESRFLTAESMPNISLTLDETDKWETLAINLLHAERELSAIELVQNNTGLDFQEARVKLYKLEEAETAA